MWAFLILLPAASEGRELRRFEDERNVDSEAEVPLEISWRARVKRENKVKLCGDQLIHMLGIICRSGRQGGRDSGASLTQEEGEDFDFEEHLHRRRRSTEQEVRGGGSPHRRKRRDIIGLSTTCCMSSCTLRQLRLAC